MGEWDYNQAYGKHFPDRFWHFSLNPSININKKTCHTNFHESSFKNVDLITNNKMGPKEKLSADIFIK